MRGHPEFAHDHAPAAGGTNLPDPSAVFGAGVVTAVAPILSEPLPLRLAEWTHVAGTCAARRREYETGRALARRLLVGLGFPDQSLPTNAGGAPIWPPGVVGSISHASGVCVVAVAPAGRTVGLGLDLEPARPIGPQLACQVLTPRERAWLTGDPDPPVAARIVFSAKESVYKSLYPLCGVFLDFRDLEVRLNRDRGTFAASLLHGRRDTGEPGVGLRGTFCSAGGWIVTGIRLLADMTPPSHATVGAAIVGGLHARFTSGPEPLLAPLARGC